MLNLFQAVGEDVSSLYWRPLGVSDEHLHVSSSSQTRKHPWEGLHVLGHMHSSSRTKNMQAPPQRGGIRSWRICVSPELHHNLHHHQGLCPPALTEMVFHCLRLNVIVWRWGNQLAPGWIFVTVATWRQRKLEWQTRSKTHASNSRSVGHSRARRYILSFVSAKTII